MYYDGWSADVRADGLDCARVRVGDERWKQIEPIAHRARHDGSESGPELHALNEHKRREEHPEPRGIWKDRGNGASLDSFDEAATMMLLDERARAFNQASVVNAGRTRGFASAATEAQVEMTGGVVVEFDASFGERLHQVDATARRIHLASSCDVSWAGLGAKSAVNAVEQQIVVANVAKGQR
jgi:hypothetical protein